MGTATVVIVVGQPVIATEVDATGSVLLVDPGGAPGAAVAATVAEHLQSHGSVWVDDPPPGTDEGLAGLHLRPDRDVLRLERALPASGDRVDTRAFAPGRDEPAWVAVNNRAFAGHREQGSWTVQRVLDLEEEDWFDPAGFLLHERAGRLAGFCWTKVHRELEPPAGEIFVIAVDPDFAGLGLGGRLTMAGLHHLAGLGLTRALLYVDAGNATARAMYDRLGFQEATRRRLYVPVRHTGATP
jgi:mycothiol synthase